MDVETLIEPPGLTDDTPDDDRPTIYLHVCLYEGDGTNRAGSINVDATATDTELADALIAAVRGCATMRGPGLATAINNRLRG